MYIYCLHLISSFAIDQVSISFNKESFYSLTHCNFSWRFAIDRTSLIEFTGIFRFHYVIGSLNWSFHSAFLIHGAVHYNEQKEWNNTYLINLHEIEMVVNMCASVFFLDDVINLDHPCVTVNMFGSFWSHEMVK